MLKQFPKLVFVIIVGLILAEDVCPIYVAGGFYHSVAVKSDGSAWAWGNNEYGQIGNGTTTAINHPIRVNAPDGDGFLPNIVSVAAGWDHSIALDSRGNVWAWGRNNRMQLGDMTTRDRLYPVMVMDSTGAEPLRDIWHISTGFWHNAALTPNGNVWTWGYNTWGQLGDGTETESSVATLVLGPRGHGYLNEVQSISSGAGHTVALRNDGTVWAWGLNDFGQLGDGTDTDRSIAMQATDEAGTGTLRDIIAIASGRTHTLALKSDGTVLAWGRNNSGQLGDGTTTDSFTPKLVMRGRGEILTGIVAITAGQWSSFALTESGAVYAWGNNMFGQLGDGTLETRYYPVQVHGLDGAGYIDDISFIFTTGAHTLAIRYDGFIWAWGRNHLGQLGDYTNIDKLVPTICHLFCLPGDNVCEQPYQTPLRYDLTCYPNPFNSAVTIRANAEKLAIYDIRGRIVDIVLVDGADTIWRPSAEVESGVYTIKAIDNSTIIGNTRVVYLR